MTNLATAQFLAPSNLQLPVSAYFDVDLFQREMRLLFKQGPGYVGHELMVPEKGSYRTLAAENEGRILVRNREGHQGVELLSNVCRHRQALMLNGSGQVDNIVCPLHRWTYDLEGQLLGAPHFGDKPCLHLGKSPLQNWQGLLFEGPRDVHADLGKLGVAKDLDFSGYLLDHVEVHECNYNWKTFIEVYLEDYHVAPFHPGLGKFVSCEDLHWEFGSWHSVQTVGIHKGLSKPFYYPEEIVLFEREFVKAERAAYMETCIEDDEIAERMDAGRAALMARGQNEVGPYQSPMEDGMQHFHEWYRREINYPA